MGTGLSMFIAPTRYLVPYYDGTGPWIRLSQLPEKVQSIISLIPYSVIDQAGYLNYIIERFPYYSLDIYQMVRTQLVQTQWNKDHSNPIDELTRFKPWAIVLHWYGDHELYDKTITGYLRGFNHNQIKDGNHTLTSAHFLVGDSPVNSLDDSINVIQTQKPSPSGVPYLASSLTVNVPREKVEIRSKFLRAAEKLHYQDQAYDPIIIDICNELVIDPNRRSIAIEVTGLDFDDHYRLSDQKIANVVSVIWALMKRYHIPASDLVGHHEIQMDKRDPGDKFMATIRYLVGIKGLLTTNSTMKDLVFGPNIHPGISSKNAAIKYFTHILDFMNLITYPRKVYEWISWSKYLDFIDLLMGGSTRLNPVKRFISPIQGEVKERSKEYKLINGYKGVEIIPVNAENDQVLLVGDGVCVDIGKAGYNSYTAVFRHRLLNGAEIVTIYKNLTDISSDLQPGEFYSGGLVIGSINESSGRYLCLAVAFNAPWISNIKTIENGLSSLQDIYLDDYFLNPNEVISI
jgi:hypothetical protein